MTPRSSVSRSNPKAVFTLSVKPIVEPKNNPIIILSIEFAAGGLNRETLKCTPESYFFSASMPVARGVANMHRAAASRDSHHTDEK